MTLSSFATYGLPAIAIALALVGLWMTNRSALSWKVPEAPKDQAAAKR